MGEHATPYRVRTWPCPLCGGDGCEECDETGQRWRVTANVGGFNGFTASGTGEPSEATVKALQEVCKAAINHMEAQDE